MRPKVVRAIIKGWGKDENGVQQYAWLTEAQAKRVLDLQGDTKQANALVRIGDKFVRISDIMSMEFVPLTEELVKYSVSFKGYVLEALAKEQKLPADFQKMLLGTGYAKLVENYLPETPPPRNEKLDEMKRKLVEKMSLN